MFIILFWLVVVRCLLLLIVVCCSVVVSHVLLVLFGGGRWLFGVVCGLLWLLLFVVSCLPLDVVALFLGWSLLFDVCSCLACVV